MYPRKTKHAKSRRIIYKFSYKMGVLNEKRCKKRYNIDEKDITTYRHYLYNVIKIKELMDDLPDEIIEKFLSEREILNFSLKK